MNRVLVVSMPRAGTTWVGQALGHADDASYVGEPDNERKEPYAVRAKRQVGRFPILLPDEEVPQFERLWDLAFEGWVSGRQYREIAAKRLLAKTTPAEMRRASCHHEGGRSMRLRLVEALAMPPSRPQRTGNVVVKSVYAPLCLEWLERRYHPQILMVLRHPLNMIASWLGLGYRDCCLETKPAVRERFVEPLGLPLPDRNASSLARIAWEVGLINSVMEDAARAHPAWHTVTHEELCEDPESRFKQLSSRLGLRWGEGAQRFIVDSNREGDGYKPQRITREQPERWRTRLSAEQIAEIVPVLRGFPLQTWSQEPVLGS